MASKSKQFREGVEDFTKAPDRLRTLIERGSCTAVVNFHVVDLDDGTHKLAMISAGMSQNDIFDACCVIRRTMMLMLGLAEKPAFAEAMEDDTGLPPADDEPERLKHCELCARDHWTVLAKCEHRNCPKGLYAP